MAMDARVAAEPSLRRDDATTRGRYPSKNYLTCADDEMSIDPNAGQEENVDERTRVLSCECGKVGDSRARTTTQIAARKSVLS